MVVKTSIKESILRKVSIIEIAKEAGLVLESNGSGAYDFKVCCPSKNHKGGQERTPSCYLNSKENKFWCFGCQSGINAIDFYMLCHDISFSDALSDLRKRVGNVETITISLPTEDNLIYILDISNALRKTMKEHPEDLQWINHFMMQVDEYIEQIDNNDSKAAKALLKRVRASLKKRYE